MHYVVLIIQIYLYVLIARIILSWFPISSGSPMMPVVRALGAVTDPVLKPVRALVPPMAVGSMGIDLSPLIVVVVLQILLYALG